MSHHEDLVSEIGGQPVTRLEVQAWEARRARKVLAKLGETAPTDADVDQLRDQLLAVKERIGPDGLQDRLDVRLRVSGLSMRVLAKASGTARSCCSTTIRSPRGRAEDFAIWFNAQSAEAYSSSMLAACPDHYVIGEDPQGRQKVIETTGGSPLPTLFLIDYEDTSGLRTPADSRYPVQIAGVARDTSDTAIGGVRHQLRDLDDGFEAWLTVEFPGRTPSRLIRAHRWHLACEFGNWIEFALPPPSRP